MTTHSEAYSAKATIRTEPYHFTRYLVPIGRVLFALMFILSAPNHFARSTIDYAAHQGVPATSILVPIAGIIALIGGLSVAIGLYARVGALLLALFLIPVTLWMHAFWNVTDPMQHMMQMINFLKNVSMLGGALLMMYFGAGPFSVDNRAQTAAPKVTP